MIGRRGIAWFVGLAAATVTAVGAQSFVVGSKNFTEGRLLGEIVAQYVRATTALEVEHRADLGGTMVCWQALREGEIDCYVEYTGTAWSIILKEPGKTADRQRAFLHVQREYRRRYDIEWSPPFGLNNSYVMAVRRAVAQRLGLTRISDLIGHGASLRASFTPEFVEREDGWAGLRTHYPGLDLVPRAMEHGLVYAAVAAGEVDVFDAYSTDGKLLRYDVVLLDDDRGFFPPYQAAPVVRGAVLRAHPELRDALWRLAFTIDDRTAMRLNHRVEVGGERFEDVARSFLRERGLIADDGGRAATGPARDERGLLYALWNDRATIGRLALEHLGYVALAVAITALLAIPLGVAVVRVPRLRGLLLGGASVVQTIPSLALLAFLIAVPWVGLGERAAILALVLYAVLPILRNTVTGLESVDPVLVDAARGLGMTPRQVLWRVRFPLALRTILAGVRTAAVISVGVATLAAFIGAGGLGQPIVTGLYLNDVGLVLSGAIPAALLALAVDGGLGLLARVLTPRGLRE